MRVLFYSPDSYGLGHVRRSISVAKAVLQSRSVTSALMLTGAPRAHYFDYPSGCDYVKLPSITKNGEGRYVCRDMDLSLEKAVLMRGSLIDLAADAFQPRMLLVDHSPRGLCGEILPTLSRLGERGDTFRVLGMRDVIDEPRRVKKAWEREGVIDVLRHSYDHVIVYGQRDVFDPIKEYGIPADVARKMTFVGYIPRNGRKADPAELRRQYAPRTGRLVVVTVGGGGDGNLVLRSFLEGYRRLGARASFEVAAVTGPLMSPGKREGFRTLAEDLAGLTLIEYTDALPDLVEAADFVVSMGGYNTVCELACAGAPALILPRSFPRQEQLLRARLLAKRGVVRFLDNEDPSPDALMREVAEGLGRPRPAPGWGLDFAGLDRTAEVLSRLGAGGRPHGAVNGNGTAITPGDGSPGWATAN